LHLVSDHPGAIAVPGTVTVPAGQTSVNFTATVYVVAADTNVVLIADGPTASASVTVPLTGLGLPLPQVSGTAAPPVYNPANGHGGEPNNYAGVEDFLQWLPSGIWNDLSAQATITGYLVEYEPPIARLAPSQVVLTPNPVTGGQTATGTVTLSQPAGPNDLT